MKPTVYEIERWIEIHFQRASQWHADRWYILNSLTSEFPHPVYYLSTERTWQTSHPKFFDTPEEALEFWKLEPIRL